MIHFAYELFLLFLFLLLSAFFSGSETALFSLNRSDLHRLGQKKGVGGSVARAMKTPQKILITILIGNLFVNLAFAALTTNLLLKRWDEYGHYLSIGIVTPLVIIFCEISPKVLAINSYERFSLRVFPLLSFFHKIFFPLRFTMMLLTNFVVKRFGLNFEDGNVTEDELSVMIHAGTEEGIIEKEEGVFINNVLRFSKKDGSNIMFPRNRAVFIQEDMTVKEAMKLFLESDTIRAPVCRDNPDHIIGMIDSKDLIPVYMGYKTAKTLGKFIQPIDFFPATMELSRLLNEFLNKRIQIAVMVDEYGGTAGVVTLNAILTELMGKRFSKWDVDSLKDIRKKGSDVTVISGEMQLDDFNYHFNEELSSSEADTVAGYMTEKLAHFPGRGETVKTDKYMLRVRYVRKNRLETIDVIKSQRDH